MEIRLEDYVDEFAELLKTQLISDRVRWGDTWRHRPREGQEVRFFDTIRRYFDRFRYGNKSIPWFKVSGEALIGWVRETYPETYIE